MLHRIDGIYTSEVFELPSQDEPCLNPPVRSNVVEGANISEKDFQYELSNRSLSSQSTLVVCNLRSTTMHDADNPRMQGAENITTLPLPSFVRPSMVLKSRDSTMAETVMMPPDETIEEEMKWISLAEM
jgi:hypothetical protein